MKRGRLLSRLLPRLEGGSLFERMFVDNDLRSHIQTILVCGLLAAVSGTMFLINITSGMNIPALCTGAFALLSLLSLAITVISGSHAFASTVMAAAVIILFSSFLYDGGVDGFSPVWICLLPPMGMFFFGIRKGTAVSAAMLAVVIAVLWTPLARMIPHAYSKTFQVRFPIVYMSSFIIAFALEYYRHHTQKMLENSNRKLEAMSLVDQLTGVENRRAFDRKLDEAWNHALRTGGVLSLLMIDIDYFKRYNDHYGQLAGDTVLIRTAEAVSGSISRKTDTVARWGGEEFAVLLPYADPRGAGNIALAVREAVEKLGIPHKKTLLARKVLTISIGAATIRPAREKSSLELVALADQVLYAAKSNGRDRIETDFISA